MKGALWYVSGVFFGFSLIWLILGSEAIFVQHTIPKNVSDMMNDEFLVFLSLALFGGAYTDYVLSVCFLPRTKLILGLCVVIGGLSVFLVFHNLGETYSDVKYMFTVLFCVATFIFCVLVKSAIYCREEILHNRFKRYY